MSGTAFQSVTRITSPKLNLIISYLLEDELSFFSEFWIHIIDFFCTPRIRAKALTYCWCCCHFLLGMSTYWWHQETFKVTKIIPKKLCKHLKNYYLEVHHLLHFDYNYLLVATLTSPMYKWRPLQHLSCALALRFIFSVWKWAAKML